MIQRKFSERACESLSGVWTKVRRNELDHTSADRCMTIEPVDGNEMVVGGIEERLISWRN
eukprot:scaffold2885_cov25-Prasinocladus_malaysianus.AAC.2